MLALLALATVFAAHIPWSTIIDTCASICVVGAAVIAGRNWDGLRHLFRSGGVAKALEVSNEALSVYQARLEQQDEIIEKLERRIEEQEGRIVVLTELVTRSAAVDNLTKEFEEHRKQVMESHAKMHQELHDTMTAVEVMSQEVRICPILSGEKAAVDA